MAPLKAKRDLHGGLVELRNQTTRDNLGPGTSDQGVTLNPSNQALAKSHG